MSSFVPFPQEDWDCKFLDFIDAETQYVSRSWGRFVHLAAPPDAQGDWAGFEVLMGEREVRKAEILAQDKESKLENALWPVIQTLAISDVTASNWPEILPCTWKVLLSAFHDLLPGLYLLKQHFNRGRPSHTWGEAIGVTTIPTPGHPAYPGGHATQAQMAVLLLKHLLKDDPDLMTRMQAAARRIAANRVAAGIHFPSDSGAGESLAQQFVPMLLQSELFEGICEAARSELRLAGLNA
jgi:hypothetical protein